MIEDDRPRQLLSEYMRATTSDPVQVEASLQSLLSRTGAAEAAATTSAVGRAKLALVGASVVGVGLLAWWLAPKLFMSQPTVADDGDAVARVESPAGEASDAGDASQAGDADEAGQLAAPMGVAPEPSTDEPEAPAEVMHEAGPEPGHGSSDGAEAPTDDRIRRRHRSKATTPAQGDAPPSELTLMAQARRAVRASEYAKALELLDRHAQLYPDGQFADEREATRVTALCGLDPDDCER